MNKSIKAINKKNISNSRTQYLNHIRLYKISITVLRFLTVSYTHLTLPTT